MNIVECMVSHFLALEQYTKYTRYIKAPSSDKCLFHAKHIKYARREMCILKHWYI